MLSTSSVAIPSLARLSSCTRHQFGQPHLPGCTDAVEARHVEHFQQIQQTTSVPTISYSQKNIHFHLYVTIIVIAESRFEVQAIPPVVQLEDNPSSEIERFIGFYPYCVHTPSSSSGIQYSPGFSTSRFTAATFVSWLLVETDASPLSIHIAVRPRRSHRS